MNTYIALLRGVNVGGAKRIKMDGLRELFTSLGFLDARTYVQSGNLVFKAGEHDLQELTSLIENRIQGNLGFTVEVFLRRPHDLHEILENNPFLNHRHEDPSKLHVTFLYQDPPASAWEKAIPPAGIADEFIRHNMAAYVFCPNGYGRSKLANDFFERKLGVLATTRNWNTVNVLYQMSKE